MPRSSSLYMQTTRIAPEKSIAQINALLGYAGARQILTQYDNHEPVGVGFIIEVNGSSIPFKLPANVKPVFDILQEQRSPRNRERNIDSDMEQAKRTAWRLILRWVQAQLALIETGMVRTEEVFLPYAWDPQKDQTFYERIAERNFKMLPMSGGKD